MYELVVYWVNYGNFRDLIFSISCRWECKLYYYIGLVFIKDVEDIFVWW